MQPPPRNRNTLAIVIGVLVVLGLCGCLPIFGAILFPVFSQARLAAQQTVAANSAADLARAALAYAADNDGRLPPARASATDFRPILEPYLEPGTTLTTENPNGGEFLGNEALGGVALAEIANPARAPLFFESRSWPGGKRAVAFADGQPDRVVEGQLAPALANETDLDGDPLLKTP